MARPDQAARWVIGLTLAALATASLLLLAVIFRSPPPGPEPAVPAAAPQILPTGRAASPLTGVVTVLAQLPGGRSTGTGMVVAEGGLIVTAYHVVQGSTSVSVGTPADRGSYAAVLVGFDEAHDVALLRPDGSPALDTVMVAEAPAQAGDPVLITGATSADGGLRTLSGVVTAVDADLDTPVRTPWNVNPDLSGLIRTDLAVEPFDCGGPALTPEHAVIGLTVAGSIQRSSGYLMPIETVRQIVTRILTGDESGSVRIGPVGMLGIAVDASSQGRDEPGLVVSGVTPGSPAEAVGLVRGDRLTKMGEHRITGLTDLTALIRRTEPGDEVTLEWRDAQGGLHRGTVEMAPSSVN